MKVKLTYYKPTSGKYYAEGEYETAKTDTFHIYAEVREKLEAGILPGLVDGHSPFIVHIDIPEHPHNVPQLILPR